MHFSIFFCLPGGFPLDADRNFEHILRIQRSGAPIWSRFMENTISDENFKKSNHAPRRAHDLISGESRILGFSMKMLRNQIMRPAGRMI